MLERRERSYTRECSRWCSGHLYLPVMETSLPHPGVVHGLAGALGISSSLHEMVLTVRMVRGVLAGSGNKVIRKVE